MSLPIVMFYCLSLSCLSLSGSGDRSDHVRRMVDPVGDTDITDLGGRWVCGCIGLDQTRLYQLNTDLYYTYSIQQTSPPIWNNLVLIIYRIIKSKSGLLIYPGQSGPVFHGN